MFIERMKLIALIVLCLSLGLLGGVGIKTIAENMKHTPAEQLPRGGVTITIDKSQQEELFDQLESFADKWDYAIRIAPTTPSGEDFSIALWRQDINIFGANPFD